MGFKGIHLLKTIVRLLFILFWIRLIEGRKTPPPSPTSQPSETSEPSWSPDSPSTSSDPSGTPTPSLSPSMPSSERMQPSAQPSHEWKGCAPTAGDSLVSRTEKTFICVMVGPSKSWMSGIQYLRYSFKPNANQYSRITMSSSYNDYISQPVYNFLEESDISVLTASGQGVSFLRKFYDREQGYIFPFLTAIIDVKDGVVDGILWDDACVFCAKHKCLENTYNFEGIEVSINEPSKGCYITKEQCDELHESGGNDCDLTVYFVWTGTDQNGSPLTSFNNRFSMFQPSHAHDTYRDNLPRVGKPNWVQS